MSDPAHSRVDTIHTYWNVTLKNEFSEFFIKREPPKYNGLEVPQDFVEASMNQTGELMTEILSVLMKFEKSCDISISDMLLHTSNPDLREALSVSGYFILKIERYFMALDKLQNLKQTEEKRGKLRTSQVELDVLIGIREQNLLCKKLSAFFSVMASVDGKRLEVIQELLSLAAGVVHYLKLLIQIGLIVATDMDPHNKQAVISDFLADVEKAMRTDMQLDLQQRFHHNNYLSHNPELCTLCETEVVKNPRQGCYWTYGRIYHIDCINCPSCNGPPNLVYVNEGKPFVECSRCNHGSMMTFISQNFGQNFVILHSRSLINAHLLYVAWARAAYTLKPKIAPCM
jgi:hypothetical protein